ncbi:MAG: sulfate permease [Cyanobacteria bacterium K_Offshore_surface_m2_239]|nr:sulfate permease [Cyanobacteria bacterium K_Offshore_surface_m2_239]
MNAGTGGSDDRAGQPPNPWHRGDLLAGITVAAYLVPQCLAYGELAGLPPVTGLWTILPALLLYPLVGRSPQLSVGPETSTALMTAAVVTPLAAGDPARAIALASLLALLVGLLCGLGAALRLGFLADLLSKPILVGYLAGVAVLMISGQLHALLGTGERADTLLEAVRQRLLTQGAVHGPTVALALAALALMLALGRWAPGWPAPLLAVLLASAAVPLLHLDQRGVVLIGSIPGGLPWPRLPPAVDLQALRSLLTGALGIALVGYSDTVLTGRSFAQRRGRRLEADRELLALALVNAGSGLFQGFPASCSNTRTALADAAGCRSQRYAFVAAAVTGLVLVGLRPLMSQFPRPALAAIVVFAALRLLDPEAFVRLWRFRPSECLLALGTLAGVLLTGLLTGVALAVGLSVVALFGRLARPHAAVMGEVPGLAGYHNVEDWDGGRTIPGLVLFRYDAPLCFANAEDFRRRALAAVDGASPPAEWLVLNAEAIVEIDSTAAEMLLALPLELAGRGVRLGLARVKRKLQEQLAAAGVLGRVGPDHVYPTIPTAVAAFFARQEPRKAEIKENGKTSSEARSG